MMSTSYKSKSKKNTETMITSNASQPFLFSVTMDMGKTRVKIQAKHRTNSDEQYSGEYTEDALKQIKFMHSIKGFYNRLRMAFDAKNTSDELCAYYSTTTTAMSTMRLTLEESSKFDDESVQWQLSLGRKKIQRKHTTPAFTISTTPSSETHTDTSTDLLPTVIKQVKDKFASEKQERLKLEERIEALEQLCTKLTKKLVKVTNDLKLEKEKNVASIDSQEQKSESVSVGFETTKQETASTTQTLELKTKLDGLEKRWGNELHIINQKMDDIRPKLVRLKTRRDFASEQAFVDYITNKLDNWDANKFGPILVRVLDSASGKAKHFIGYVGEPQKWNHTICKVQWFGLGKKQPEAVEWKALDIFLPLSAFYYPDCPHARAHSARENTSANQQL